MRLIGKMRMGFFLLPLAEAERIRNFLEFPSSAFSALDPCIGDGKAFDQITSESKARRYGIELDAYRSEQALRVAEIVIQGSCFDVHCPVDSFSLLYLNPPYDVEMSDWQSQRTEKVFLESTYRWLRPAGVLVFVIPAERIADCHQILACHFCDIRIYRLTEPESLRYHQVVVFGVRRTRRERERMRDQEIQNARQQLVELSGDLNQLPPLSSNPDCKYIVPDSEPVTLVHSGLPLDEIEELLVNSPAYRQADQILFGNPATVTDRPLTPLHGGHVGLLACAGLLNGIFGCGDQRHVAAWQSRKAVISTTEEEEDGTVVQREREYFVHEVSLVFATGETAILK